MPCGLCQLSLFSLLLLLFAKLSLRPLCHVARVQPLGLPVLTPELRSVTRLIGLASHASPLLDCGLRCRFLFFFLSNCCSCVIARTIDLLWLFHAVFVLCIAHLSRLVRSLCCAFLLMRSLFLRVAPLTFIFGRPCCVVSCIAHLSRMIANLFSLEPVGFSIVFLGSPCCVCLMHCASVPHVFAFL